MQDEPCGGIGHHRPEPLLLHLGHHRHQMFELLGVIHDFKVGLIIARQVQEKVVERAVAAGDHGEALAAYGGLVGQILFVARIVIRVLGDILQDPVIFNTPDRMLQGEPLIRAALEFAGQDPPERHLAVRGHEPLAEDAGRPLRPDLHALVSHLEDTPIPRRVARPQDPGDLEQALSPEPGRHIAFGESGLIPEGEPRDPGDPIGAPAIQNG